MEMGHFSQYFDQGAGTLCPGFHTRQRLGFFFPTPLTDWLVGILTPCKMDAFWLLCLKWIDPEEDFFSSNV